MESPSRQQTTHNYVPSSGRRVYVFAGTGALLFHFLFFFLLASGRLTTGTGDNDVNGNAGNMEVSLENIPPGDDIPLGEELTSEAVMDYVFDTPQEYLDDIITDTHIEPNWTSEFTTPLPEIATVQIPDRVMDSGVPYVSIPIPRDTPPPRRTNKPQATGRPAGNPNAVSAGIAGTGGGNDGTIPPRPKANPKPPYPASLRQSGQEGTVRVAISLDAQGNITQVTVQKSSGYPELDRAAVEFIQARWRFHPARRDGNNIPWTIIAPVIYVISNK